MKMSIGGCPRFLAEMNRMLPTPPATPQALDTFQPAPVSPVEPTTDLAIIEKCNARARQTASFLSNLEGIVRGGDFLLEAERQIAAAMMAAYVMARSVSPVEPEPPTNPACARCGHALSAHRPDFGACDGRERPCACPEYQAPPQEPPRADVDAKASRWLERTVLAKGHSEDALPTPVDKAVRRILGSSSGECLHRNLIELVRELSAPISPQEPTGASPQAETSEDEDDVPAVPSAVRHGTPPAERRRDAPSEEAEPRTVCGGVRSVGR